MTNAHRLDSNRERFASFEIKTSADVVRSRQAAADLARDLGFGAVDQTRIATAVSEIARNVLQHSGTTGTATLWKVVEGRAGLLVEVDDRGSGMADIDAAMQDGYSTSVTSLGAGLPGSRRLMDEFEVHSVVGSGTLVRMIKWVSRRP